MKPTNTTAVYRVEDELCDQGYHRLHRGQCPALSYIRCCTVVGRFHDPEMARQMARATYYAVSFCDVCCPELAPPIAHYSVRDRTQIIFKDWEIKRKLH